jgi:uncharacterized protein YbaR (Trm112 family)
MPAARGRRALLIRLRTGAPVAVGARPRGRCPACCDSATPKWTSWSADDGLQHLRPGARRGGAGVRRARRRQRLLLPAGPLREPVPDQVPARRPRALQRAAAQHRRCPATGARRRLAGVVPLRDWWPASRAARGAGRPCGAGTPAGRCRHRPARALLRHAARGRAEPSWRSPLPDHHDHVPPPGRPAPRGRADRKGRGEAHPAARRRPHAVWVAARLRILPEPAFAGASCRDACASTLTRPWTTACSTCWSARCARARCSCPRRAGAPELVACPADRLAFPVRDGIPVMLESEARALRPRDRRTDALYPGDELHRPDPGPAGLDAACPKSRWPTSPAADGGARGPARRAVGGRSGGGRRRPPRIVAACAAHGVQRC